MKKYMIAALVGTGIVSVIGAGTLATAPASAQISVFDPTNYTQNLLTAARTLQQINNQIQSLQNEARMLVNQSKNLSRIDFPQLDQLRQKLGEIDKQLSALSGNGRVGKARAYLKDQLKRLKLASLEAV